MIINKNIFRTYDIRGVYPGELNEEAAQRIAQAFAFLYPNAKKIVVARDPRLSSPSLFSAITEALIGAGREVIDIGIAPDPLFYFSIFNRGFDGGIMISGSHNPKEHNGLTLHVRKDGSVMSRDIIQEDLFKLRDLATNGNFEESGKRGKVSQADFSEEYIDYVTKRVFLKKTLKIVIDSGNGSCGLLPEKVFKKLGCETITLYGNFDGTFPHHLPDPYKPENLSDLQKETLKQKADLGFAFDTDGDRVAPIDNKGRQITGDSCLWMLAHQALSQKKGPLVHDARVSKALLDKMDSMGIKTYFSVSHHNAVAEEVIKKKAVFGGEITYHFLFPLDYYLYDDAIFASLKIAEVASAQKEFSSYIDSIPRYAASPEVFIDCDDDKKFKIIDNLQKYLRENDYDFIDVDGARINFENGWALARASNTTPMIKCRFEGKTQNDLLEIEKKALQIFKKTGVPINEKVYAELGLNEQG